MFRRFTRPKTKEAITQARKHERSRRTRRASLEFEPLEDRQLLATRIWDGGGGNDLWTTPANWSTDVAPIANDDLQFPTGGVRYSPVNDFTSTAFGSITIQDAGYSITGNPVGLAGGIVASYASGSSAYSLDTTLLVAQLPISVASGGTLAIVGALGDGPNAYGISKLGPGNLTLLSAGNDYVGTTTINAGVLQVDGTLRSAVILAGGTLSGSGTNDGPGITATDGGTVAPGSVGGPGIMTYSNPTGFTMPAGTTLDLDLNGTVAGTGYDQLSLTNGSVVFNPNGATLSLSFGFTPAIAAAFTIVKNDGSDAVAGTFAGLPEGSTITFGPATYTISYVGGDGNDVVLTATDVTYTWDGGDLDDSLWSSPDNWVGDVAPTPGSRLIFPSGALRLSSTNDLATGFDVFAIAIGASGYSLYGNGIDLYGNVLSTYSSGTSTLSLDVALQSSITFDVAAGGTLVADGAISGTGLGVTKKSGGTLRFAGTSANTYTGTTAVDGGTLQLDRSAGVTSVQGNLVIGDNIGTGAAVEVMVTDQIANTSDVTVNEGAALNLDGGVVEEFTSLTLQGSTVNLALGSILQPLFNLYTNATSNNLTSNIQGAGNFALTGVLSINVADDTDVPVDLLISTILIDTGNGSGGIDKLGTGTLALSAASENTGLVIVEAGILQVENSGALGTSAGNVVVLSGSSLVFAGSNLSFGDNFLSVEGTGVGGLGALWVASGDTTLTGNAGLTGNVSFGAASGSTLTLTGVLGGTANPDVVNGATGRTAFGGNNTYAGATSVTQGFLRVSNDNAFGDPTSTSTITVQSGASLELTGGMTVPSTKTFAVSGLPVADSSKIVSVSGTNTIQGDIGVTGGNNWAFDVASGTTLTVDGVISGSLDFDKNGTGTLVLTATNTNTGNVNVGDGTLIVNGSLAASNSVFVDGRLGGSGTTSAVTISSIGTLSPGNSPGILHTGNLAFTDSGSTYAVQLDGAAVGTGYDQADVTGTVTLAGATLSLSLGYLPAPGTVFTIINNDSTDAVSGTFNGIAEGATFTIGLQSFTVSYIGGTNSNDVTLTALAQTYTWDGGGADNNWSTAANWVGNIVPTSGSNLVFPSGAAQLSNVNDLSGWSIHSIVFVGAGYTMTGNSIFLTGDISTIYASGSSLFGLDITLGTNETIDVAAGGTLDLSGAIGFDSGGNLRSVTKNGGGTLRYLGTTENTYNGWTTINGGTLVLAKSNDVISSYGSVIVGDNTTGASLLVGANNQFWVGSDITVNEGSTFDISTYLEHISNLNLQGSTVNIGAGGVLYTFVGVNTYTTTNNVTSVIQGFGVLDIDNSINGFTIADDPDVDVELRISTILQGSNATSGFFKAGSGTLALSGPNTFGGDVIVYEGAVQVESNNALGTTVGSTQIISGGSVYLSGTGLTIAEPFSIGGTGTAGEGALWVSSGDATLTGPITLNSNAQIGAGTDPETSVGLSLTIEGVIDDDGGTKNLTVLNDAMGRTILAGANLFDGDLTVSRGFLRVTGSGTLGDLSTSSTVTIAAGASLELSGGIIIPATKSIVLDEIQVDGSSKLTSLDGDNTINGSILFLNRFQSIEVANGSRLTISGAINGLESLDKNGNGTLLLSGLSTLTGQVNAYSGTLVVTGNISTSSGVVVTDGGTLTGTGTTSAVDVKGGGTLAPGVGAPGILNTGGLVLDSNALYVVDLSSTLPGSQYDQVNVAGAVALSGSTLSIHIAEGFVATSGQTFTIINNDGIDVVTGTFAGLAEGAVFVYQNQPFRISYVGGTGNDVVLTSVAIVAFPATLVRPTVGSVYTQQITASGGSGTGYVFTATGLPAGLSMNASGLITGTPTTANAVPALVQVTIVDSLGATTTKTYPVTLNPAIVASPPTLNTLIVGTPYSQQVTASGGSGSGYIFSASGLPQGLSISSSGLITGTPTSTSPASVLVTITDGNGASIIQTYSITANRAASTASLSTSSGTSAYGQSVSLSATVTSTASGIGLPTGSVQFFSGSTLLGTGTLNGQGVATLATSALGVGANAIIAMYLGDANHVGSTSSTTSKSVSQSGSTSSLAISTATPDLNQPITLTATVVGQFGGTVGGTVSFFDGPTLFGTSGIDGQGIATLVTAGLGTGTHAITAVFNGDANVVGSTSPAVTVTIKQSQSNAGKITSSNPQVFYGENVVLSAVFSATAVGDLPMTGTVSFYDFDLFLGMVPLTALKGVNAQGLSGTSHPNVATVSGHASLTNSAFSVGHHAIRATYSGDLNYSSATSETPVAVEVERTVTRTTLTVSTTPGGAILSASVIVTSPGDPSTGGTVFFYDNDQLLGSSAVVNSVAIFNTGILTAGQHSFRVVFSGAGNSQASGSSASVAVPVTVLSPNVSGTVYLDLNANAVLDAGEPGMAGRVVFLDLNHDGALDPGDPTTTTDADGHFVLTGAGTGSPAVLEATGHDTYDRYVVNQTRMNVDGSISIGVVPISPIDPVKVVPNPFSTTPSVDANTAYVQALYRAVLGRTGADSEVETWTKKLHSGTSRRGVALGIIRAREHREGQVRAFYEEFFHRTPDAASNKWVKALMSGKSEEQVAAGLLNSTEYHATHRDPKVFIEGLYIDVLGRLGSEKGRAYWVTALASGSSRKAIVSRFLHSDEASKRMVESYYTAFLRRQPEPVTSEGWAKILKMPNGSATRVTSGILASSEFYLNAVSSTLP